MNHICPSTTIDFGAFFAADVREKANAQDLFLRDKNDMQVIFPERVQVPTIVVGTTTKGMKK